MNLPKKKVYKNGATLIYKKRNKNCTSVVAGFVFGRNRDNYPEPTAHFLEHMFFKATENKTEKELRNAQLNTFSMKNGATSLFYTEIDFCRSNKVLPACFDLASEMLLKTKFNTKSVNSEKGVIKQELVRKLNNPDMLFWFTNFRTLRNKYALNTNVLGSEEEINAMDAKTLKKFRDEVFISQNFVITIEGGISYNKAKRLAEKYFINKLNSNPSYSVDQTVTIPIEKKGNLNIEYYNFKKAICRLTILLDKDEESLKNKKIMNILCKLSNGMTGKVLGRLRDNGLVYSGRMDWATNPQYAITVDFSCSSDNVNKCIEEIGKVLNDYRTKLVENDLIEKIKENAKLSKDERINQIYPSSLFMNYLYLSKEEMFSKKYQKESKKLFESITADDIKNFSKTIFSKPENIYVSILTEKDKESFYNYQEIQNILIKNKKPRKVVKK